MTATTVATNTFAREQPIESRTTTTLGSDAIETMKVDNDKVDKVEEEEVHDQEIVQQPTFEYSWEPEIAVRISNEAAERDDKSRPFMVALVGIPGSGKSVSALLIANSMDGAGGVGTGECMIMPHDGYHYPMESLKLFPNAEDAIYRRGAPDTFDPAALLRDLKRIREGTEEQIKLPAFVHEYGDPEPDRFIFDRSQHTVVLCEGLYLLHEDDGWEEIKSMFDLTIFINSDLDICIERLKIRNQCIPGYTPEEIDVRCERVDRVNGELVLQSKHRADIIVESLTAAPKRKRTPSMVSETDEIPFNEGTAVQRRASDPLIMVTQEVLDIEDWKDDDDEILHEKQQTEMTTVSWEKEAVSIIANKAKEEYGAPDEPYMVALVGCPGSGKTLSAFMIANLLEQQGLETMIMPHDGYHYPINFLHSLPDAEEIIYRRGAPDTFDTNGLLRDLTRIKHECDEEVILLPGFDHSHGDPEPNKHIFDRKRHKIVLCEGLWLLHQEDGWEPVSKLFDYKIFMNSDVDVCIERVKIRNKCIPGYTPEEIDERSEKVDRANALLCMESKINADFLADAIAH